MKYDIYRRNLMYATIATISVCAAAPVRAGDDDWRGQRNGYVVTPVLQYALPDVFALQHSIGVFTDIGDASPDNVAKHLRPHFVRMSATRASARALRRALNISEAAVEELGDEATA